MSGGGLSVVELGGWIVKWYGWMEGRGKGELSSLQPQYHRDLAVDSSIYTVYLLILGAIISTGHFTDTDIFNAYIRFAPAKFRQFLAP